MGDDSVRKSGDRPIGSFPSDAAGIGTGHPRSLSRARHRVSSTPGHAGVHGKDRFVNRQSPLSRFAVGIAAPFVSHGVLGQGQLGVAVITATRTPVPLGSGDESLAEGRHE